MKRFFKSVGVEPAPGGGFHVCLDGRPVRTPLGKALLAGTEDLARAIADEWEAQGKDIRPATMPLTQLLNTQIDKIEGDERPRLMQELASYALNDPLCYFVESPADLAARQEKIWRPLINWAENEAGLALAVTTRLAHQAQPENALRAAYSLQAEMQPPALTGFQAAAGILGSFVTGLAFVRRQLDVDGALETALLEELYQAEKWGRDEEQGKRHAAMRAELLAVKKFLDIGPVYK